MEKKKNIFDKAVDALTNRDEKAALEKAQQDAAAAQKEAAELRVKVATQNAAAAGAAAAKAAADRAAAAKAAADAAVAARKPHKGIVNVKSLRIRKYHDTVSPVVAGLVFGEEVAILDTFVDGKNTWAQLGTDRWAAMIYEGETYIKVSE